MAAPEPASAAASTAAFYDALAPVYDRWQRAGGMTPFSEVARDKLLPALERFGAALPVESSELDDHAYAFADVGCGTGDLLLGLGRAHPRWRLVGLDGSAGMLEIARAKPGADRVQWMEGTLAAPALPPPPLDAVGCFYDTLNHLPDVAALAASVRGIAAGLRPGGLFVFDATNELGFDRWWRGNRAWHGRGWRVVDRDRLRRRRAPGPRRGHHRGSRAADPHVADRTLFHRRRDPGGAGGGRHRRAFAPALEPVRQ